MWNLINKILTVFHKLINLFFETCFVYLCWILIHTLASNLYSEYCAKVGFFNIIISTLTINSPHCNAFRWLVQKSSLVIENMWFLLGGYFSVSLVKKFSKQ